MLEEIGSLRSAVEEEIRSDSWQWLLIWSVVCLGAGVTAWLEAVREYAGFYWLPAVPLALAATAWVELRIERRRFVRQRVWPYWATGAGIGLANLVGSIWFSERVIVVWVWVVLAAGFSVLCRLGYQDRAARVFVWLAGGSALAGVMVSDTFALYPVLALVFAVTTALLALDGLREARRR